MKKILGVIGGLGPAATTRFMQLVQKMTDAPNDQAHVNMIVYQDPSIPDRTGYILKETTQNPLPQMIRIGEKLAVQGAECIAIPCITAHYFYRQLQNAIPVPIINAVTETAKYLKQSGVHRAGIMATDGTIRSRLLEDALDSFLELNPFCLRRNDKRM